MTTTAWGKWFWADWLADSGLRACSAAARGIWMDLLCVAASHEPPGYVAIGGRAMTVEEIARLSGVETDIASQLVGELKTKNVCSRTEDGTLYSRRMIRDSEKNEEHEKQACAQCGEVRQPQRSGALYCSTKCKQKAYRTRKNSNRNASITISVTNEYGYVTDSVTDNGKKPKQNQSLLRMPRARARAPLARKESKKASFSDPDYERRDQPQRPSPSKTNNAQSPPASGPATALPDGRAGPPVADSQASEASKRPHELTKAEFEAKLAAKRKSGEP
jgi:hypothetical protein